MTDVRVQAQRLPGVGWRYVVPADSGRQVTVVGEDRGSTHLILVDPALDEALTTVRLSPESAAVLAALLTGARYTLETPDPPETTTGSHQTTSEPPETTTGPPETTPEPPETPEPPPAGGPGPDAVVVETVHIGAGSPVVGLRPDDVVARLGSEAALLGVICEATPQLLETDGSRAVQLGDKLVVAARRARLSQLRDSM